jgi:hypothetical protein
MDKSMWKALSRAQREVIIDELDQEGTVTGELLR